MHPKKKINRGNKRRLKVVRVSSFDNLIIYKVWRLQTYCDDGFWYWLTISVSLYFEQVFNIWVRTQHLLQITLQFIDLISPFFATFTVDLYLILVQRDRFGEFLHNATFAILWKQGKNINSEKCFARIKALQVFCFLISNENWKNAVQLEKKN